MNETSMIARKVEENFFGGFGLRVRGDNKCNLGTEMLLGWTSERRRRLAGNSTADQPETHSYNPTR
jgi:hypothetical protein